MSGAFNFSISFNNVSDPRNYPLRFTPFMQVQGLETKKKSLQYRFAGSGKQAAVILQSSL